MTAPDHMFSGTNLLLHEPGHPHMEPPANPARSVLQHFLVKRNVRDDLLQSRVFLLEFPEPLHL